MIKKLFSASAFSFLAMTVAVLLLSAKASAAQDQPTIAKDSVQVNAYTLNVYKKNYDNWSWVPQMEYRVNGPIASGSQLYAEFTIPGTGPWVKFDCKTEEVEAGKTWKTECGGRDGLGEDKGSTYTGTVNFVIKMRNELAGADATLFTGRMKVGKAHSNESGPESRQQVRLFRGRRLEYLPYF